MDYCVGQSNIFIGANAGYQNVAIGYMTRAAFSPAGHYKPPFKNWYAEIEHEILWWVSPYKDMDNEIRKWMK